MFRSSARVPTVLQKQLWSAHVFGKQTVRELHDTYALDRRAVRKHLDAYQPPAKIHHPRPVHLVVDAVYWGSRVDETDWCSIVARDQYEKEDLWWTFAESEMTRGYALMYHDLSALGYTILAVTGDGFGGIRQAFSDVPFQMCLVHMERLVIKGTTRKPQLEAGQVLLALVRTLFDTDSHTFRTRLRAYAAQYGLFLNERTVNPFTGKDDWTHREVRAAYMSLCFFERWLFAHEHNPRIPRTTNSLESHFGHVEDVVDVHRGLSRAQKEKMLHSIFLAGTIAPDDTLLGQIL